MRELQPATARPRGARLVIGHVIVAAAAFGVPLLVTAVQAPVRSDVTLSYRLETALAPLFLVSVLNYVTANLIGLPNLYRRFRTRLLASIGAPAIAASLSISLLVLVQSDALPRSVFFVTPVLLVPCYFAATVVANGGAFTKRRQILVVMGEPDELELVEADMKSIRRMDAQLLGTTSENIESLARVRPDVLVLCKSSREDPALLAAAESLHLDGSQVRRLVDFYEEWLGKLPLQELETAALFTDIAEVHAPIYLRGKRWIDVVAGLTMLLPLVVVGGVVAVANRVASPGPLIFKQPRVGLNGQVFDIFKFRTMQPTTSTSGVWTADGDPRITKIGRILRTTHLDELPQAVNILRGDLSMVGPRPEQVHYVEQLSRSIPFYELRHAVRPGLTGWAQVKYPYGANERDAVEKLQYELYYIRHQRLSLDLQVMAMTVRNIVAGGGK